MKRLIIHLLIFCAGVSFSYAQDVVLWKHVLRFSNDRYLPKGYIASKYCYRDTTLLYKMDYSDNGWQIYDSITYKKHNGLWCISHFEPDTNSQLYLRFSDTVENPFRMNKDILYVSDKYNILPRYLNEINNLIYQCKTDSLPPILKHLNDTCCYLFVDVDHTLLFADYGIPMEESLERYCCHIGRSGEYDWDKFIFSNYTVMRYFDYDKYGNICKVTITRTHNKTKENVTWIESFFSTFDEKDSNKSLASPLQGQNGVRDSLIDESLRDFFSEHRESLYGASSYMIAAHTFPYDYDLSKWNAEDNIDIADFNNKKTIRQYKRAKNGLPTVCLKWRIDQDGSVIYKVALYYVKVNGDTIDYAISDACIYYYRYSNSEERWIMTSKSCNGV